MSDDSDYEDAVGYQPRRPSENHDEEDDDERNHRRDSKDDEDLEEEDEEEEDPEETIKECCEQMNRKDYIMEPGVYQTLQRFFNAGGQESVAIDSLSSNYWALAQTANLFAEWLILSKMSIEEVQSLVEDTLKQLIIKHFDPKKADSIFMDETADNPEWLSEMIVHPTWRSLIYKLAETYPDCLMLTFTIKLISDAGFQSEITSISTASQQLEVFARITKASILKFIQSSDNSLERNINDFSKMVCHGEHTFLYSQALLHLLSQEPKNGPALRRLQQEAASHAQKSGNDSTPITLALNGATAYPRACQALSSMLTKNALNPADITVLYKGYQTTGDSDPPPVSLLLVPQFLDLLLTALFVPGVKMNAEHRPKYVYLLAYASSVFESHKKGIRKGINRDELKATNQAIDKISLLCVEKKSSTELLPELNTFFQCIRFPVVALGVCEWVRATVTEKQFFQLSTDHVPLHLALLDEIVTCHQTLHSRVLAILITLFESDIENLDVLVQLEVKKMLIDRMVHLLSRGHVVPVVSFIRACWQKQEHDVSLIRYFVTEVLDIVSTPYSEEFANAFLPLVTNAEITGKLHRGGDGDHESLSHVSQFIRDTAHLAAASRANNSQSTSGAIIL